MKGFKTSRPSQRRSPAMSRATIIYSAAAFIIAIVISYVIGSEMGPISIVLTVVLLMYGVFNLARHILQILVINREEANYSNMLRRADVMQHPNIHKISNRGENEWLSYGFSCMQGWRRSMEDDHVTILTSDGGFFGVFDGHSGANVAKFCGDRMFEFVSETEAFKNKNYKQALYDGFIAIDQHLYSNYRGEKGGCTAVVLLVKGDKLYCGNAGDSRSILCRDAEAVPLSKDHKPFLPEEQTRIERAGGYVWNRRVNGALALSRAIGDFSFKSNTQVSWAQQAVTSAPEINCSDLDRSRDEFAVIACDGIWDVMTNEQVVNFVRPRIQSETPLDKVAEELIESCLSPQPFGLGCDNMSVVIVKFNRHPTLPTAEDVNPREDQVLHIDNDVACGAVEQSDLLLTAVSGPENGFSQRDGCDSSAENGFTVDDNY
ncbi:unnamed protein product [Trypanosoma congolense IL3000]|uniref:protein-serine/threonine phosphatase n=1 Tax=Trypanosoma congolense (strain IL3000) TaxID=1068625 RepID=F9W4U4_TRYCI|nr:unnamed protein product [Trypanosoma congolense IL3000]